MGDGNTNAKNSPCLGCLVEIEPQQGIIIPQCQHLFCKVCLQQKLNEPDEKDVNCPYKNDAYVCNAIIEDLKDILTEEIVQYMEDMLLRRPKNEKEHYFECKTPDCKGWCIYTEDMDVFICTVCNVDNCLICLAVHAGINCEQYWEAKLASSPEVDAKIEEKVVNPFANDEKLILNKTAIDCLLCSKDCEPEKAMIIRQCRHSFCTDCIKKCIMDTNSFDVKCPFKNEDYSCNGVLDKYETMLISDKETYVNLLERALVLAEGEKRFICTTIDCIGWCIYTKKDDAFLCPDCGKRNCFYCKVIHEGKSCEEFIIDLKKKEDPNFDENSYDRFLLIQDLVYNTEVFECGVCICDCEIGEGVILSCNHSYCKECLRNHVEQCDETEVACPFGDGKVKCDNILRDCEIRELVNEEYYNKYVEKSLRTAQNTTDDAFVCKSPDCKGWCIYNVAEGIIEFECYICGAKNCLVCKDIHTGKTCDDYQEDYGKSVEEVMGNEMVRAGTAMRCHKCLNVVEKVLGCDWIQCIICKTELCWATKGPRWGPAGAGDVSGGCRCNVAGKLCTPTCGNCH